ncbi:hypothetical protein AK812_SmicGene30273 [Symbiodinium microadriaticum]|uniref:Uncharacterized protein n=1 Tax=Symbiodinium microadriaticum TaxID=2951 RepID=A0A1Q9CZP8_SYMMI|nr:hypothetical protein AK812_SmicGene30273 [Symbiodinium microadriaticum]
MLLPITALLSTLGQPLSLLEILAGTRFASIRCSSHMALLRVTNAKANSKARAVSAAFDAEVKINIGAQISGCMIRLPRDGLYDDAGLEVFWRPRPLNAVKQTRAAAVGQEGVTMLGMSRPPLAFAIFDKRLL